MQVSAGGEGAQVEKQTFLIYFGVGLARAVDLGWGMGTESRFGARAHRWVDGKAV